MADRSLPTRAAVDWNPENELVVATEHLGFVEDLIGPWIRRAEHSAWLGLSRLLLSTDAAARALAGIVATTPGAVEVKTSLSVEAAAIRRAVLGDPDEAEVIEQPTAEDLALDEDQSDTAEATGPATDEEVDHRAPDTDDPMSAVLADLRALAVVLHGGWMPTIGRNRLVELPGSGDLAVTSKTSYGKARVSGAQESKTSYGSLTATGAQESKTSYGGSEAPQPIDDQDWAAPSPRPNGPGSGVRVGLVDTQLWPHPWLAGGWVAKPTSVVPPGPAAGEVAGHGTFVGGLILSQAPGAVLELRSALDDKGEGTTWSVATAIADLAQSDVAVINLSFACYTDDGQPPLVLARAIDRVDADVVVVAAAGNHAGLRHKKAANGSALDKYAALPAWPAALDDVLAVGSLDCVGDTADFSPERPWVDVAVRGTQVFSTYPADVLVSAYTVDFGDGWAVWSGTSFSAALVSGAIAASVDPGRVSAIEAVADLLSTASRVTPDGDRLPASAPGRLSLRLDGWVRSDCRPKS